MNTKSVVEFQMALYYLDNLQNEKFEQYKAIVKWHDKVGLKFPCEIGGLLYGKKYERK